MGKAKPRRGWSNKTGERGRNRVRAFEDVKRGVIFLEFGERDNAGKGVKKRVSAGHADRERAKGQADELAFRLTVATPQVGAPLTLQSLFDRYERDVTPTKGPSARKHDRCARLLFESCWGARTYVKDLDRRDWDRFITTGDKRWT